MDPFALFAFFALGVACSFAFIDIRRGRVSTRETPDPSDLPDILTDELARNLDGIYAPAHIDTYARGHFDAAAAVLQWLTGCDPSPQSPRGDARPYFATDGRTLETFATSAEARAFAQSALEEYRDISTGRYGEWPEEANDVRWGLILQVATPDADPCAVYTLEPPQQPAADTRPVWTTRPTPISEITQTYGL